jgi:hypothetical protein
VYVRIERGGEITETEAINTKVANEYGLKVDVGPNQYGDLVVLGLREGDVVQEHGSSASLLAVPDLLTKGTVSARRFQAGLVSAQLLNGAYTMSVYIAPFTYMYNGALKLWPGGWLDLTSSIPGTANKRRWVLVGVNPETNVAATVNGTDYGLPMSLTVTQLVDIDPGTMIPLAGVNLFNGQTAVDQESMFADARPWYTGPGYGPLTNILHNLSVTTAPTVNDDVTLGYGVGSLWVNVTLDHIYLCTDATDGAAVWQRMVDDAFDAEVTITVATTTANALTLKTSDDNTTNPLLMITDSANNTQVSVGPTGAVVLNEEGNDADFRVESNNDANNLFSDGGNDNIGIGTGTPDASAKIDVSSTTKALLPPRMTTTQRDAISSPADGLVLYNTTTNKMTVRQNGAWKEIDVLGDPVVARYTSNAGQSIPDVTSTTVNFEDVVFDPYSAVTTGASWVFTAPTGAGGTYLVTCEIQLSSTSAWDVGELAQLTLRKNGTDYANLARQGSQTTGVGQTVTLNGATLVDLAAGDTIDVQVQQNSDGALSLTTLPLYNHISIARIPS